MKNNFYLPYQFFENRRSMRVLLFLRMIDLTEHFTVKQKSILKHQTQLDHGWFVYLIFGCEMRRLSKSKI